MPLNETFTEGSDVDLDAHTSDSGHSWSWVTSGSTTKKLTVYATPDTCGRSTSGTTNITTWYSSSWTPSGAEYDIEVDLVHKSNTNLTPQRFGGRFADTSNHYEVVVNASTDTIILNKRVSNVLTELANVSAFATTPPETRRIKLEIRDVAKKVFEDGVEIISNSDNEITATGKVALGGGIGNGGATTGLHFDNLTADNAPGGGAFTLTADPGSLAITGSDAGLRGTRKITAETASYTITGTAATLRAARKITSDSGSVLISGTAATLRASFRLIAAAGAIDITGTDANLRRGRFVIADPGAYTITGTAAALRATRLIAAASGSYVITGTDAELIRGQFLTAQAGSFVITGTAASLEYNRILTALSGSFAITGTAAGLIRGRTMTAAAGGYAITGTAATFRYSRLITAAPGSVVIVGQAATLSVSGSTVQTVLPAHAVDLSPTVTAVDLSPTLRAEDLSPTVKLRVFE